MKNHVRREGLHSLAVEDNSNEIIHCHSKHQSILLVPISSPVTKEQGVPCSIVGHIKFSASSYSLLEVSNTRKFFLDSPWLLYFIFSVIFLNETI